ncbi:MAG: type II secretion system protein GspM [Pseudomonadota bacterium]
MTAVQRGCVWIFIGLFAAVSVFAAASLGLWRAGDETRAAAARYAAIASNKEAAQQDLVQWRVYAEALDAGYLKAASAAEAEAALREKIGDAVAEARAELASIQTRPAERGDPSGMLRLRVVLTTPEAQLPSVLATFSGRAPATLIERAEIRYATGIRRPGSDKARTTARALEATFDVVALWKDGENG